MDSDHDDTDDTEAGGRTAATVPMTDDRGTRVLPATLPTLTREDADRFAERYELTERLGAGGMGEVHACLDRRVGREVAMKRLLPDADVAHAIGRFVREARVQGRLEHPSVVPVHDMGVDPDGRPYFVMKKIGGLTLSEVLRGLAAGDAEMERRFPRRRLLAAFAQACLALDLAHERGVIHRDLKPSNLMLGEFGEVYLLDWGIARVEDMADDSPSGEIAVDADVGHTRPGSVLGTPGYAPPEQLRGDLAAIGPRSDIYAMGVVLFEILARRSVLSGLDSDERVARTLEGIEARPSSSREDVDPELDAICLRATAHDPAARFASMRELHDAVQAFLSGERSEELRRELAARHAEAARAQLAAPADGPDSGLTARRRALAEVGRAIALDPEGGSARALLLSLLDDAPAQTPTPVADELVRLNDARVRQVLSLGVVSFLLWFGLVPLFLWMGLREPWALAAAVGGVLLSVAACAVGARRDHESIALQYVVFVGAAVAIVIGTRVFGIFVMAPQIVMALAFSGSLSVHGRHAWAFVGLLVLGLAIPAALEAVGLWAPAYAFVDGGVLLSPRLADLTPTATIATLWVATLLMVVACSFWARAVSALIVKNDRALVLQRWQLAQAFGPDPHPPEAEGRGRDE